MLFYLPRCFSTLMFIINFGFLMSLAETFNLGLFFLSIELCTYFYLINYTDVLVFS